MPALNSTPDNPLRTWLQSEEWRSPRPAPAIRHGENTRAPIGCSVPVRRRPARAGGRAPLSLRVRSTRVGERAAYVGNAAQTLHPVAGQGLNLGLRDAWDLAQAIASAPDPGDAAALRRYASLRRLDAQATVRITDFLAGGFAGRCAAICLSDQGTVAAAAGRLRQGTRRLPPGQGRHGLVTPARECDRPTRSIDRLTRSHS